MEFTSGSFFQRLVAYLIDTLPISLILIVIAIHFFGFGSTFKTWINDQNDFSALKDFQMEVRILGGITTLLWIIYSIVADISAQQGSFGKKIMKIKVVNEKGERLTFEQSFKRNTTKTISMLPMNFGFLWMIFDPKKQTWHDKIGESYVVSEFENPKK
jgi:uncharacterized RDD family membrane protein YckC